MKRNLLSILALGLGFTSMAQIVYTDINDVTLTSAGATVRETLNIDLDNDGTVDYNVFSLDTNIVASIGNVETSAVGIDFKGSNQAAGVVSPITGLGDVIKLEVINSGTSISSSTVYAGASSSSSLVFNGGGLSVHGITALGALNDGNFTNTTDKYVGVSFMISGAIHYGWIRVDVADNAASVTVKDFAYEQTPGVALEAGQTVAINENELANVKTFYANNQLNINGVEGNFNVSVIDLLGKSISNENVNGNSSINLNMVNNGIYLVKITKGNSVVTKKVYIK